MVGTFGAVCSDKGSYLPDTMKIAICSMLGKTKDPVDTRLGWRPRTGPTANKQELEARPTVSNAQCSIGPQAIDRQFTARITTANACGFRNERLRRMHTT